MVLYSRSTGFSGGGDVASGPGAGLEGAGAGLSAGAESHLATSVESQLNSFDVRGAHQFFQPGGSEGAALMSRLPQGIEMTVAQAAPTPAGMEAALAAPMPTGAEAAALAPVPAGMESALAAPIVPGANEISPMIQLIMKLPGAMGLLNSFFEALAAFFAPQQAFMQLLDPTVWANNLKSALTSGLHPGTLIPGAEHASISLSLLPANAHILQSLGLNGHHFGLGLDGVYGKMAPHLGNTSFNTVSSEHIGHAFRDQFKVSGQLDLNKPQYEMGSKLSGRSELISGPSLSDSSTTTHLAGNQRIFSDRSLSSALANNNSNNPLSANTMVSATNTPPVSTTLSQTLPLGPSQDSSLAGFNVSDSAFSSQPEALPAVASAQDGLVNASSAQNVGFNLNDAQSTMKSAPVNGEASHGSFGPSGMIGKDLIALEKGGSVETFRPTLGSGDANWAQPHTVASPSYPAAPKPQSAPLNEGLRAKQLSLESVKNSQSHTARPVMDHFGYQSKAGHSVSHVRGGGTMDGIAHRHLPKAYGTSARPNFAARSAPQEAVPVEKTSAGAGQTEQQMQVDGQQMQGTDIQNQAIGADGQIAQATDGAVQAPSQYTIRSGDCLWNIAKDHLGNGLKWQEIYKMNGDVLGSNPDLIYPGTTIQLPGGSEIANGALEGGKYVVKPGDNLWDISKELLGDGTKWGDLYKANIDVIGDNPRLIFPGQELTIPGAGGGDLVASAGQTTQTAAAQGVQQTASAATSTASVPTATAPASAPTSDLAAQAPQTAIDNYGSMPEGGMAQPGAQIEAPQMAPHVKPAVNTAPGPGAAGGHQMSGGPGAAEAATLEQADASLPVQQHSQQQISETPEGYTAVQSHKSVVTSSLAADLTTILQRRK